MFLLIRSGFFWRFRWDEMMQFAKINFFASERQIARLYLLQRRGGHMKKSASFRRSIVSFGFLVLGCGLVFAQSAFAQFHFPTSAVEAAVIGFERSDLVQDKIRQLIDEDGCIIEGSLLISDRGSNRASVHSFLIEEPLNCPHTGMTPVSALVRVKHDPFTPIGPQYRVIELKLVVPENQRDF